MKILIHFDFDEEQLQAFRAVASRCGDHEIIHARADEDPSDQSEDVEVILGQFKPAVCAAARRLRWIQSHSTGMDKFLFPEIVERDDVAMSNMSGKYAPQGAEHAWGLLLALSRGILSSIRRMEQGSWGGATPPITLTGATLGIIGMGGFGMEMVKRAAGYDMTIIAIDPVRTERPPVVSELKPATRDNLHDLLRRSDVVMTACPRVPETYHLIGPEEFAAMKSSAYLINVTRGGIIDEAALIEALEKGAIAGAGIDVTEKEPLPATDPLWKAPNLIITGHCAGASQHRPRETYEFFLAQLERFLTGQTPENLIDKRKGF